MHSFGAFESLKCNARGPGVSELLNAKEARGCGRFGKSTRDEVEGVGVQSWLPDSTLELFWGD